MVGVRVREGVSDGVANTFVAVEALTGVSDGLGWVAAQTAEGDGIAGALGENWQADKAKISRQRVKNFAFKRANPPALTRPG